LQGARGVLATVVVVGERKEELPPGFLPRTAPNRTARWAGHSNMTVESKRGKLQ
jgi:hypothetical protein